jgi:hypothetical protein
MLDIIVIIIIIIVVASKKSSLKSAIDATMYQNNSII